MTDAAHALVLEGLSRFGIVHELIPCDPDLADTSAFCAHYGFALDESANTIVVVGKADPPVYAACVALASTRLDVNGLVRRRLGVKKASFAGADVTIARTGMSIGGVTAIGLSDDMPVWVDAAVMARRRVVLGGGSRSSKLLLDPAELLKVPTVEVVSALAVPRSEPVPQAPPVSGGTGSIA